MLDAWAYMLEYKIAYIGRHKGRRQNTSSIICIHLREGMNINSDKTKLNQRRWDLLQGNYKDTRKEDSRTFNIFKYKLNVTQVIWQTFRHTVNDKGCDIYNKAIKTIHQKTSVVEYALGVMSSAEYSQLTHNRGSLHL